MSPPFVNDVLLTTTGNRVVFHGFDISISEFHVLQAGTTMVQIKAEKLKHLKPMPDRTTASWGVALSQESIRYVCWRAHL